MGGAACDCVGSGINSAGDRVAGDGDGNGIEFQSACSENRGAVNGAADGAGSADGEGLAGNIAGNDAVIGQGQNVAVNGTENFRLCGDIQDIVAAVQRDHAENLGPGIQRDDIVTFAADDRISGRVAGHRIGRRRSLLNLFKLPEQVAVLAAAREYDTGDGGIDAGGGGQAVSLRLAVGVFGIKRIHRDDSGKVVDRQRRRSRGGRGRLNSCRLEVGIIVIAVRGIFVEMLGVHGAGEFADVKHRY